MKKNKVPHPNKLLAKHEYEIEQKAYFDKIKRAKSVLKTDNNNYDKRIQERKRKESRRSTDEEPCSSAAPSSREWHSSQPHQPPSNDFEPSSTLDQRQQEEENLHRIDVIRQELNLAFFEQELRPKSLIQVLHYRHTIHI